jgi:P27 family predicted phage terminase small subunit
MLNDTQTYSKAPKHLGRAEKKLYEQLMRTFRFDDAASVEILLQGLEARQRAREAREQIAKDGLVTHDERGVIRPHPLLRVERSAQQAFLAAMRALRLDVERVTK